MNQEYIKLGNYWFQKSAIVAVAPASGASRSRVWISNIAQPFMVDVDADEILQELTGIMVFKA